MTRASPPASRRLLQERHRSIPQHRVSSLGAPPGRSPRVGHGVDHPGAECPQRRHRLHVREVDRRLREGPRDHTVQVWDLTTGTPTGPSLTGHTQTVSAVAALVLPDGRPCL
jgi:hypothetical protein